MADLPLHGMRVVVTRAREASEAMARRLAGLGAEPIILPAIEIVPLHSELLDSALQALQKFDWVVFTSANAVRVVCDRLDDLSVAPAELSRRSTVASIGPKTSAALRARDVEVGLQPDDANAEALVSALVERGVVGRLVLVPASRIARPTLADGLRQAGAGVVRIAVYDTIVPETAPQAAFDAVTSGEADVVTFTSPSTVENFMQLTGSPRLPAICIGSATAEAARSTGLNVVAVACDQSVEGLLDALVAFRKCSIARE